MNQEKPGWLNPGTLLLGGLLLVAIALLLDLPGSVVADKPSAACQKIVAPNAVMSRKQLAKLLTIPERNAKQEVRAIVKAPYCQLAPIEVRAGVSAEREAYPLEFDPQTWLVILYEGDEYAGYRFTTH